MPIFAGMLYITETSKNIDQIPYSFDVMSIFLGLILRDFLIYIIPKRKNYMTVRGVGVWEGPNKDDVIYEQPLI